MTAGAALLGAAPLLPALGNCPESATVAPADGAGAPALALVRWSPAICSLMAAAPTKSSTATAAAFAASRATS